MANRSYLYSTDRIPGSGEGIQVVGITEWNYEIPILHKLLLSGGTQPCKSLIWDDPEVFALAGDYQEGVRRLRCFLLAIKAPHAQSLVAEALEFLDSENNRKKFFFLECAEIFDLEDEPFADQLAGLLEEIRNIDGESERVLSALNSLPTGPDQAEDLAPFYAMGLGNWSNCLYFDIGDRDDDSD